MAGGRGGVDAGVCAPSAVGKAASVSASGSTSVKRFMKSPRFLLWFFGIKAPTSSPGKGSGKPNFHAMIPRLGALPLLGPLPLLELLNGQKDEIYSWRRPIDGSDPCRL